MTLNYSTRMFSFVLIVITTLTLSPRTSQGVKLQGVADPNEGMFIDIRNSVEFLNHKTIELAFKPREKERMNHALSTIIRDIDFIQTVALKGRMRQIPEAYLHSLRLNADLLQQVRRRTANGKADAFILDSLELVASDLNLKAQYIRSSRGSNLRLVEVLVHTLDDRKEVGGYEVWYVPVGWVDEPREYKRFGRLSSPTYMDLTPGNYLMWSRLKNRESEKTNISVGKNGRSRDEVDLIVE
jgi:hypothetical protein